MKFSEVMESLRQRFPLSVKPHKASKNLISILAFSSICWHEKTIENFEQGKRQIFLMFAEQKTSEKRLIAEFSRSKTSILKFRLFIVTSEGIICRIFPETVLQKKLPCKFSTNIKFKQTVVSHRNLRFEK